MSGSQKLCRWALAAAAFLLVSEPAFAEKRVALVLGNSNYQNVAPLANPVNDSARIAATLKDAGFDVVDSRRDLSAADTRRALRDFADRSRDADIAVVYYAGHGIEVDGGNYLIPVDARLERDTDVYDEALSLDRILVAIEPAKKLRLVILDACRDNPFSRTMKRTVASRAIGQGLAKVEPTSPNVLIAYSAKAGSTAADGDGKNSPFTSALSHHLTKPGLDVRRAFGFVRDEVLKTTGNRQEPFVYGSLGGEDVPLVPAPRAAPAVAPAPAPSAQAEARRDYELALQIGNKSALNAFLAQYPDGFYASLAKLQLDKIAAEETRVAATEKARQAEQERARLAAEGAQKSQQAKAEADVKAAERARVAAEKAKQVAQDQAAAAEQKRVAAESAPADKDKAVNVATLAAGPPQADVTKSVQAELRRVGCLTGNADGNWNNASQRSLTQFNRYAGTRLDTKVASVDTLDTIKLKSSRVCPLVCEHGFQADGDRCTKITCAEGSFLNDDNECEKRRAKKPVATRERPESRRVYEARPVPQATKRVFITRSQTPGGPGMSSTGQPLTGDQRLLGCNSREAIMSGKCP
ncbi:caspase family protein [Bradyrhizobium sp. 170]|uniref:caspase family protein n=1 Tax=Bradyrhizobium sp. 170 TaxID=2782641 RepID=UPI001FFEB02D|nr:caspase family protein [Bradyrhizobium sp. 170]UPK03876.1 caspase family protein [Bradyrhizobium sp. 170]